MGSDEFFCQVYRRRAEAIEAMQLVPSTLCQRLAYFSGGRVRDFVASVRDLADRQGSRASAPWGELLTYGALLPYPGGSEWYYPPAADAIGQIRNSLALGQPVQLLGEPRMGKTSLRISLVRTSSIHAVPWGQSRLLFWVGASRSDSEVRFQTLGLTSRFLNDSRRIWVGQLEPEVRTQLLDLAPQLTRPTALNSTMESSSSDSDRKV